MKTSLMLFLAMALAVIAIPVLETGCGSHAVTLQPGGAYTDPYLATTDQAILDGAKALDGFMAWYQANAVFLEKYPEVGKLAAQVKANQNEWIRNAYSARDAYAEAAAAYRAGKAGPPSTAAVNAAISVITNVATQINAYRAAHQ